MTFGDFPVVGVISNDAYTSRGAGVLNLIDDGQGNQFFDCPNNTAKIQVNGFDFTQYNGWNGVFPSYSVWMGLFGNIIYPASKVSFLCVIPK